MCSLITLINVLMNKKARHISKRKAGISARKRLIKLHTSEYENSCFAKKKKIVLYFKEDTIDSEKLQSAVSSLTSWERTVQAAPSKKKKNRKKGKGKGKEKKRECEQERKEKGKGEERGERERREEKRGKRERREEKEEKMERA